MQLHLNGFRTKLVFALLLGVMFAWFLWPGSVQGAKAKQPRSYLMVCKGGGSMALKIKAGLGPGGVRLTGPFKAEAAPPQQHLGIRFEKAKSSSSVQSPRPGECAWVDRPIRREEPNGMRMIADAEYLTFKWMASSKKIVDLQVSKAFKYIVDKAGKGELFYVHVYNDTNRKVFIITKTGP